MTPDISSSTWAANKIAELVSKGMSTIAARTAVDRMQRFTFIPTSKEDRTLAAETPLHEVSNKYVPMLSVAFRYAFYKGRKAAMAALRPMRMAGSAKSGNFGHAGRPGKVGGSSSSGLDHGQIVNRAANWVHRYMWKRGEPKMMPPTQVEDYLKQFRPTEPVELYRFERPDFDPMQREVSKNLIVQSWSHDEKMVRSIVEMDDSNVMQTRTFQPDEIFTDFTMFPDELKAALKERGSEEAMQEVLVYHFPFEYSKGEYKRALGDRQGHPFRGNQWTDGRASVPAPHFKDNGTPEDPSDFINNMETAEDGVVLYATHYRGPEAKRTDFTDERHAYFHPAGEAEFDNIIDQEGKLVGGELVTGVLTLNHPRVLPSDETGSMKADGIEYLKQLGYDGVVNEEGWEVIAFYPKSQLKEIDRVYRGEDPHRQRTLGSAKSGNYGHAGRPGKVGGSSTHSLRVPPDALDHRTGTVTLFHSSPDESAPTYAAFFGTKAFYDTFPKEFGDKVYELKLPPEAKVIDLNRDTQAAYEFKARMILHAYPNDASAKQTAQDYVDRKISMDSEKERDFYDDWTDKDNIVAVLRNTRGADGARYQDEYLLSEELIHDVGGATRNRELAASSEDAAVEAITIALQRTLPQTLQKIAADGGEVAVELMMPLLRMAGDKPGHPFHGNQWTDGQSLNLDKDGYAPDGTPGPAIARREGALWLYRASGHMDLNAKLMQGEKLDDEEQKIVKQLDAAMRPLQKDVTLYRNTDVVTEDNSGYLSTSLDPNISTFRSDTPVRIDVPAGTLAIRIGDYYAKDSEQEVILARGTQLRKIADDHYAVTAQRELGSAKSGNRGHAGRPGKVGGSAPASSKKQVVEAINTYGDVEQGRIINNSLRGKNVVDTMDLENVIPVLDAAMTEGKASEALYRAIVDPGRSMKLKKGDTFIDKGFVSTTKNQEDAARMFAAGGSFAADGETTIFTIIDTPASAKRIDTDRIKGTLYTVPNEVILARGTKFKVKDVRRFNAWPDSEGEPDAEGYTPGTFLHMLNNPTAKGPSDGQKYVVLHLSVVR